MLIRKRLSQLNQTGDTIVEVLVAMAVMSSVLGVSYATANRSLKVGRTGQERTEASRLAQAQLESIRAKVNQAGGDATVLDGGVQEKLFCIDTSSVALTVDTSFTPTNPVGALGGVNFFTNLEDINSESLFTVPAACKSGEFYHIFDARKNGVLDVIVRWDDVSGNYKDQVVYVFKLN